jgi:hypothetical protein
MAALAKKALANPLASQIGHNNSVSGRLRPVLLQLCCDSRTGDATKKSPSLLYLNCLY